jgi:hypothetical protein
MTDESQALSNTEVLAIGEWLKTWALTYSDTAQALITELQEKPHGGFTCYIKKYSELRG